MTSLAPPESEGTTTGRRTGPAALRKIRQSTVSTYVVVVGLSLVLWQLVSLLVPPLFLPGPVRVLDAAIDSIASGELLEHVGFSYMRVLTGWVIGALVAVPLGLVAGRSRILRVAVDPYLNFFRFIPPIAFISLALIWLGIGEASKIALIIYASLFIVFLNTVAGAQSVDEEKVRAAQCLGASRYQVTSTVIVPATVPHIITGLRTAMGNSFMTVVAAELVAADEGVGFLIYNSRLYARTDLVFVGIIALGIMGFVADFLFRTAMRKVAYRYGIKY